MKEFPDPSFRNNSKLTEDKFAVFSTSETANPSLTKPSDLFSPTPKHSKFSPELLQEKLQIFDVTNETSEFTKPAFQAFDQNREPDPSVNTLLVWLTQLELEHLHETLAQNGYDDLSFLVEQMKTEPLDEEFLQKIGIEKLGHRKIFLACLEEEGEKYFRRSCPIKSSCCTEESMESLPDLAGWLRNLYLENLYELFVNNGFKDLKQILFLMNSNYPITDEVLKEIGVSKVGHRQRILFKLKADAADFAHRRFQIKYELNHNFIACGKCLLF